MRKQVLTYMHTIDLDLQEEFEELKQEEKRITLNLARRGDSEVSEDGPPRRLRASQPLQPREDLEAALADVRERLQANAVARAGNIVEIVIQGMPRKKFRRLLTEHPPRDDVEADSAAGYNTDTFGDLFIQKCIVGTRSHKWHGRKPVPNEWDKWADEMSDVEWEDVFRACLAQTRGDQSVFPR